MLQTRCKGEPDVKRKCQPSPPPPAHHPPAHRRFTCRMCGKTWASFKALREHQLMDHVSGRGIIYSTPDWVNDADAGLRRMFTMHQPYILRGHDVTGRLTHVYNFAAQTQAGFTPRELDDAVHFIYEREGRAFRLNAAVGSILQNRETGEYRSVAALLGFNIINHIPCLHVLFRLFCFLGISTPMPM